MLKPRFLFPLSLVFVLIIFSLTQAVSANSMKSETIATLTAKLNKALVRIDKLENQIKESEKVIKTQKLQIVGEDGNKKADLYYDTQCKEAALKFYGNTDKKDEPNVLLSRVGLVIVYPANITMLTDNSYIPNKNEWELLRFIAANSCESFLTDNLKIQSVNGKTDVKFNPDFKRGIILFISTTAQPSWSNYYLGNGKFNLSDRELRAEYSKAANSIKKQLNHYIDISDFDYLIIHFAIRGSDIGTWTDGVMKLKGEL
jgi:hypothetical protein